MLVLSRKIGETVVLPSCGVAVTVVSTRGSRVKLGIVAPPEVPVHRLEIVGAAKHERPMPSWHSRRGRNKSGD